MPIAPKRPSAVPAATSAATSAGDPDGGLRASTVADRRVMAVVTAVLLSITVLQRFAVPVGPLLSVSVLVTIAGIAFLLYHGDVVENAPAMRVFVVAMAVCFLAAGIVLVSEGVGAVTSLVYLPVIWVAFAFTLHPARQHLYPRVLARFEALMLVFAGIGIAQTLAQVAGVWAYRDYLLSWVPSSFLFLGYNTSNPIEYGASVYRANAFVFLEPSIFAQFLALALLSSLVRRASLLRAVVLGAAMICCISGTGLLYVAFGVVLLAVRRGGVWTARIVVAAVVGGLVALATPFGAIIASRTDEASVDNSSGSLRFVQPYEQILGTWATDPLTTLWGAGAGWADQLADQIFGATGLPINFSGIAKLVLEYGIPATVLFATFAVLAIARRSPSPTLAWSGLFANAVLTGALLQPQVLYVLLPLCSLFIGYRFERDLDDERRASARSAAEDHAREVAEAAQVRVTVAPADPNGRGGA
ncbi:hypothetical protein [Kineococcus terrestris]|uniref:hypothetical protein n=1 Tax=Kineococcus terrestris TaxID=2044856 RepID=UPI0034DB761E